MTLFLVTAREEGQEYVEVLIGVLTAITLLLLLVFVIILLLNRRQKLQSSPTVLKNPFGFAINMKVKLPVYLNSVLTAFIPYFTIRGQSFYNMLNLKI